ncbi:MAG: putative nucleotide-diphospho-sugar transferase [Nostoc sp.]|uniref:putative nucleotide-diphospho-sugar transferase n=1 Tax=Nostoc sp. TaxID=1180 RepID=UPI002FF44E1C
MTAFFFAFSGSADRGDDVQHVKEAVKIYNLSIVHNLKFFSMRNRGVVYCAMGNIIYLEAALISAMSLRQLEPKIPITLICDHPLLKLLPLGDYEITPSFIEASEINDDSSFLSRDIKTCQSTFSLYKETLFLDADILPLKPISELWDYLSQKDMAMVVDRLPTLSLCEHISPEEKSYTLQYLPEGTTQFNSGVILWRDSIQTQFLFELWHQEWLKFKKHDQLALVRAINRTQFSVTRLPQIYNISPIDAASRVNNKSVEMLSHIHQMCQIKAASMLDQKNDICFLHCWGRLVTSGKFRQIAYKFYPNIVEQVVGAITFYLDNY